MAALSFMTSLSPSTVAIALITLFVTHQLSTALYNTLLHPLASSKSFPGPLLQRASPLPFCIQLVRGHQAFHTQKLHEKYGSVVRIGPNHLSFTDASAWKDIYGHLVGQRMGAVEMGKARKFANVIDGIPTSVLNASREEHSLVRKALAHGFSDSSMRQQEGTITQYVDLLLHRLHEECNSGRTPLNAEAWYNYTTFDITGSLIFGSSFNCLTSSTYHPWISFLIGSVKWGMSLIALCYLNLRPVVQLLYRFAGSSAGSTNFVRTRAYTKEMLLRRLAMPEGREDLFEGLIRKREEWNLSFEKISINAFILILAGSETTATTLAGATYLLLTNPETLERLTQEVRGAFKSVDEINISSVNQLSYMLAVLNESLRIYPPVTSNLVREVPEGGAMIARRWVPGGTMVEVQHWSVNHSRENFEDPWEFRPERFLGKGKDVLEALQPFSVGPRNCLGRNLAYAEMRLILARLVYDFDMKLAEDSQGWIMRQKTFTLWDRLPLNVYFTPVRG